MKRLRALLRRVAGLLPNERRERELRDEIESHLEMHVDDNLRSGMSPDQARRDALLKLGGVDPTKEAWRERSTIPFVEHLLQDGRYAIRQLRQQRWGSRSPPSSPWPWARARASRSSPSWTPRC